MKGTLSNVRVYRYSDRFVVILNGLKYKRDFVNVVISEVLNMNTDSAII